MKRYTLLDQPAEMAEDPAGEFIRLVDMLVLLRKCREIADWHGGDSDECGELAREVLAEIDALKS